MKQSAPVTASTFSAAVLVVVLIGLPIGVAAITNFGVQSEDEINYPNNDPLGGAVSSPVVQTGTGVYDPSVTDWCNDGYWSGTTKDGGNWLTCPFAGSSLAHEVNGYPSMMMFSCSWWGDPAHGNHKCGQTGLSWNFYAFDWADRLQNETMTSFSVQFVSVNTTGSNCSDPTLFNVVQGDYVLNFHSGFAIPAASPSYRFVPKTTIELAASDFQLTNALPYGYDSHGGALCVSQFSLVIPIESWKAIEAQELASTTNLTTEYVWFELKVDNLYVPEQSIGYQAWPGVFPWDDVEPYHGVNLMLTTVETTAANNQMKFGTWGLSLILAAFALASTPFWNPVSNFIKEGMKG